jgi:glycosyltransferase involved in cell wall biosynthesis
MIIAVNASPLVTQQQAGIEQRALHIVEQWAKMNTSDEFLLFCANRQQYEDKSAHSLLSRLPANFKPIFLTGLDRATGRYLGSRMLNALTRSFYRNRADIYHSFGPMVPRTAICPVVPTIHDLAVELDPAVRRLSASRHERQLISNSTRVAARIIAVSNQTQSDISSVYGVEAEYIDVVYNGINPVYSPEPDLILRAELRERHRITGQFVLAVGSDIPRRNYGRMLTAMEMAWHSNPQVKLVLAGRNDWATAPIYKRAATEGVMERIVWVQSPTDRELAGLYRDAVLTCCASSFEGFGLSVLEGMACGSPVVCSDMRSLREVAGDAAVYFVHDDPESMGQTIAGLLEDGEYRRQLRYRGLQRATHFTWANAAEGVLKVLHRTVAASKAVAR